MTKPLRLTLKSPLCTGRTEQTEVSSGTLVLVDKHLLQDETQYVTLGV